MMLFYSCIGLACNLSMHVHPLAPCRFVSASPASIPAVWFGQGRSMRWSGVIIALVCLDGLRNDKHKGCVGRVSKRSCF
eukprot:3692767-Pyramimonas_sp.AAC.1